MKGGFCVRMQWLVPFDACSSLSEMQSKYALSSTCQARLTTVNGTTCCPGGYPGTRWTRFQSPETPGYPVTSPSPTSRIWRVPVRGGYPAGGTPSVNPAYRLSFVFHTLFVLCRYMMQSTLVPRVRRARGTGTMLSLHACISGH